MIRAALLAAALAGASPALAQSAPMPAPAPEQGAVAASEAPQLDPKSIALAHEILEIGMPPATRPAMFSSIMDAIRSQMRDSMSKMTGTGDPETDAIIGRGIDRMYAEMSAKMNGRLPELFAAMERAYARQFSFDDLTQIRAFVGTPTGQRFFSRSATVMRDPDVMEANKRSMADIMAITPQLQKQMIDELMAHIAKHDSSKRHTETHPG